MSDIICARCGEPWDSTGGLHYSNSDLDKESYQELLQGICCPCCDCEKPKLTDSQIEAWQTSIERLSDGMPEFEYRIDNKRPDCERETPDGTILSEQEWKDFNGE